MRLTTRETAALLGFLHGRLRAERNRIQAALCDPEADLRAEITAPTHVAADCKRIGCKNPEHVADQPTGDFELLEGLDELLADIEAFADALKAGAPG